MQFMALCALFLACLFRRRFPFMVSFRFFAVRFCLTGVLFGTDESPNHSLDARARFSVAQYACVVDNDVLCFVCLYDAERHTGIVSSPFSPDVDAAHADCCFIPPFFFLGAGYFSGCGLGQCFLGRYWAWDPKEVWALITFMVYGAAFHARSLRIFRSPLFFHIYMIVAFLTVLMTYFGVNYILGGMHSYANA